MSNCFFIVAAQRGHGRHLQRQPPALFACLDPLTRYPHGLVEQVRGPSVIAIPEEHLTKLGAERAEAGDAPPER